MINFFLACQPHGKVNTMPCNSNVPVYNSRKEALKLLEENSDLLIIYNMLVKIKPSKIEQYAIEIIRLVSLLRDGVSLSNRSDIERASPLVKKGEHSLQTDTDYMDLLMVLQTLSTKESYETLINQAAYIYTLSFVTKQPTVGDCCSPECIAAAEKLLGEYE